MRKLVFAAAVALLVVPNAAAGPPTKQDRQNAAQTCRAMRAANAELFRQTWGTNRNKSNAFGKCVSRMTREEHQNRHNAQASCRAEREADRAAFEAKYRNFGQCVSQQRREESREDRRQIMNAAKACKAEREAGEEAFRTKYGTNENDRNAFGKCVSQKAREQNDD